ncbi:hypothetical protein HYZ97_05005 [Candidatus Pacearchaeota archaeon]|nr:hypothetical protein [Candidatus Pacearchaeota archaeon]
MKRKSLLRIQAAVRRLETKGRPFTQGDIVRASGISISLVREAITLNLVPFKPVGEQKLELMQSELMKGTPLYELPRKMDVGLSGMYRAYLYPSELDLYALQIPADLPKENQYTIITTLMRDENKEISDLTRYVVRGLTLKEIGENFGVTKESARQRIVALGLHSIWEKRRERKPLISSFLQEERTVFLGLLEQRIQQILDSLPLAERRAYKYNLNSSLGLSASAIPHKRLVKFFSLYGEAEKTGDKRSLLSLAEESGFARGATEAGRILARMQLPSFHEYRTEVSPEKIQAVRRASDLGYLNKSDLEYFSGLSQQTFSNRNISVSSRENRTEIPVHFTGKSERWRLTHAKASRIYQAVDLGFSEKETAFVCDTAPEVIAYAIQHRNTIAPLIIKALQTIFPDVEIRKPYNDFDSSRHRYVVLREQSTVKKS